MSIKLLDCTLRDGGYLNDWNFGNAGILSIFRRLVKSGLDIVEVGFLDDRRSADMNRTINPNTTIVTEMFKNEDKKSTINTAMIDYGTCSIENIGLQKDGFIDAIRVIFKQPKMREAIKFCHQLKEKGYKVCVNPVSVTTYSDRNMLDLIDLVNELDPYAMSLVDTYGLLQKDRLFRYFYLLDNNLNKDICIGYHAHNNFQLAFSNSVELLKIRTKRNLIIDSSLYGMGKSAGNLNTELIANYLNETYGKNYDVSEILNTIELEILKYTDIVKWGYQLTYYLAASNKCHPNYVKFLENKNRLRIKDINTILEAISSDKSLNYDEAYITDLYTQYQQKNFDDTQSYVRLKDKIKDSKVLLIGPGNSIKREYDKINGFMKKTHVVTFSVNHINSLFDVDYLFVSNPKRFDQLIDFYQKEEKKADLIITNNISYNGNTNGFILNFSQLCKQDSPAGENALYLVMKMLIRLGVNEIYLAGFDGFSKLAQNYFDQNLAFRDTDGTDITAEISGLIQEIKQSAKVEFLTESLYNGDVHEP